MIGPVITINTVPVTAPTIQSPSPTKLGYNLAHTLPTNNALDWLHYSGVNAVRLFISPSSIEPIDDISPWGDGVTDLTSFEARKNLVRSVKDTDNTYIDWLYFKGNYNILDTSGNNRIDIPYTLNYCKENSIDVLANINSTRSMFPLTGWNDRWEMWQHYYTQAFILARDYNVCSYSIYNEPDTTTIPISGWIERLQFCSDAIQSAIQDVNSSYSKSLSANIYAPTTAGNASEKYTNTWGQSAIAYRHIKYDGTVDSNWFNFHTFDYHKYSTLTNNGGSFLGYIEDVTTLKNLISADTVNDRQYPISLSEYNVRTTALYDTLTGNLDVPTDFCNLAANSIVLAVTGVKDLYLFKFGTTESDPGDTYPVAKTGAYYVSNTGDRNYGGATKGAEVYKLFTKATKNANILQHTHVNNVSSTLLTYNSNNGSYYLYAVNKTLSAITFNPNLQQYNIPNCNKVYAEEVSDAYAGGVSQILATSNKELLTEPNLNPDPFYNNVSLLLHMDGVSGSQTFTDSSSANFILSAFGNIQINTTTKKFGTGSGYFDGNGDYLELPLNSAFDFGSEDFTIEMWVYPTQIGTHTCIARWGGVFNDSFYLAVDTTNGVIVYINDITPAKILGGTITTNQWQHIALVRSGTSIKAYINGIQAGNTYNIGTTSINPSTNKLRIGSDNAGNPFFQGYIDELRITKGIARYTNTFVPPQEPFSIKKIYPTIPPQSVWLVNIPNKTTFETSFIASSDTQLRDGIYKNSIGNIEPMGVRSDGTPDNRKVTLLKFTGLEAVNYNNIHSAYLSLNAAALSSAQAHIYGLTNDNWFANTTTWASASAFLKQNVLSGIKIENNFILEQGSTNLILGQLTVPVLSTIDPYVTPDAIPVYKRYNIDVTNYVKDQALRGQNTKSFLIAQDHRWDTNLNTLSSGDLQNTGIFINSRSSVGNEPQLIINQFSSPRIISNAILPPIPTFPSLVEYNVQDAVNNTTGIIYPVLSSSKIGAAPITTGLGVNIIADTRGLRTTSYSGVNNTINEAIFDEEYFTFSVTASASNTQTVTIDNIKGLEIRSSTRGPQRLAVIFSSYSYLYIAGDFLPYTQILDFLIPTKNSTINLNSRFNEWFASNNISLAPGQTVYFYIIPYNAVNFTGDFWILKRNDPATPNIRIVTKEGITINNYNKLSLTSRRDITIGEYDVANVASTSNRVLTASNVNENVNLSVFYMGSGITPNNTSTSMRGTGFGTTHTLISAALFNDEYFSFSMVPKTGYSLQVTSISGITIQRSSTGPKNVSLVYNETDYWTEYTEICNLTNIPSATNISLYPYVTSFFKNNTITLIPEVTGYFRLVPYAAVSATGTFTISGIKVSNDIKIDGTIRKITYDLINPTNFLNTQYTNISVANDRIYKTILNANSNTSVQDYDAYFATDFLGDQRPAVIMVHGGGFTTSRDKTQSYTVSACVDFAKRGYVAFAPEYRRRTNAGVSLMKTDIDGVQALIEAAIDINDFVNYIRPLSSVYNFNPDYIFLGGGSAGGVIASNVTHHTGSVSAVPDSSFVKPGGPQNPQEIKTFNKDGLKGSFAWWGSPFYITQNPNLSTSKFPEIYPYNGDYRWYGEGKTLFTDITAATDINPPKASPGTSGVIPKNSIPSIILHGSGDDINPFLCAQRYYNDLKASNTSAKLYNWLGADHSLTREDEFPSVLQNTNNFFLRRLYNLGAS